MKRIIHFLTGILLVLGIVTGCFADLSVTAYAASAYVQEYSDMIEQDGYIYYIRTSEKNGSAVIWRMEVDTGDTSKVVSAPKGIVTLIISGQQMYYTTVNDHSQWEIRTCQLNGDDVQTVCEGCVCYADSENVYYIRYEEKAQACLYVRNLVTGDEQPVKKLKAGQTLAYECTIGSDSYYGAYDPSGDKLTLYCLDTSLENKKLVRIAVEKRAVNGSNGALQISDIRQINGELYYDFGSYEGSGNFWNGTIKKLTADGKKKTVAKLVSDETIAAGSRELYYKDMKGNDYKYNLKTGKKTKYSLAFQNGISYTVLGDKTYMSDTSNKTKIVISRFSSGTNRETLKKNFISIPFRQKKNVSYSVTVKQIGKYNMVCVTGRDFTDMSYGWRGKLTGINWYITDGAGKVRGSFQ